MRRLLLRIQGFAKSWPTPHTVSVVESTEVKRMRIFSSAACLRRPATQTLITAALLGSLWGCTTQPVSQPPVVERTPPAPVEVIRDTGTPADLAIRPLLDQARHSSLRHPGFSRDRDAIRARYANQQYAPLWLDGDHLSARGETVLALISQAPAEGLDPRHYDTVWLHQQIEKLPEQPHNGNAQARVDVALSVAFARLIHDVHAGRIPPREAGIRLDTSMREAEASHLVKRAFGNESPDRVFAAARPRFALYERLKSTLAEYRELAANRDGVNLPGIDKSVKPGESWRGVPALADWLTYLGDYAGNEPRNNLYSGELVSAVKRFQQRHGLADDGVIGRGTHAALTTPLKIRVRQIELSMERMRWLSERMADERSLVVNIPQFVLWGFPGHSEASSMSMNVVVGKSVDNNTPVLLDEVERVVFNPYWNVPSTITKKELLPKLHADPNYLVAQNMEMVGNGEVIATPPTPEQLDALARGEYRLRQRPGPGNALGRVKFEFPNNDAIYMHDTPNRGAFYNSRRDASHGCIRLSDPQKMANFLLAGQSGWDAQRIAEAMHSDEKKTVELREPVPVLLFYTTAIVDGEGKAVFLEDIYGYDSKLDQSLYAADQRQRR